MGFSVDAFNLAKCKMLGDFNKALSDADDLRKAEMEVCAATARAAAEKVSGDAGASASRAGEGATGETADAAGDCNPVNPQSAIGTAAAGK
jgi:hypothetical protein